MLSAGPEGLASYRWGEAESPGCGATGFPLAPPPSPTLPTEHAQLTCCNYKGYPNPRVPKEGSVWVQKDPTLNSEIMELTSM